MMADDDVSPNGSPTGFARSCPRPRSRIEGLDRVDFGFSAEMMVLTLVT